MSKIRLLFAPENIGTAEQIAGALADAGYETVNGREAASAAFVIWSAAAAASSEILAAARSALARRVLVPVAIGKAPPPSSFEHLWPVDIAGWDGSRNDPRWRFVLDEVELAVRRGIELPPADAAPLSAEEIDDDFFADPPIAAGGRAAPTPYVPRAAMLGAAAAVGLVAGGVVLAVIAVNKTAPAALDAPAPPVVAFVTPKDQDRDDFAAVAAVNEARANAAPPPAGALREALTADAGVERPVEDVFDSESPPPDAPYEIASVDETVASAAAPAVEETGAPIDGEVFSDEFAAPRIKPFTQTASAADATLPMPDEAGAAAEKSADKIAELAWSSTANADAGAAYGLYLRDCLECPDLAEISAGTLAPEPGADLAVPLMLRKPIAVAVFETTFDEWNACVSDGACPRVSDNGWGGGDRPVVNVTFEEAEAYAGWLSRKTGREYRLPTETEWEYAARAGSLDAYSFGATGSARQANFSQDGASVGRTLPVGRFAANLFGLFDMHGNAAEWTADCWAGDAGATLVGSFCSARVIKGGGWSAAGEAARASARDGAPIGARRNDVGFRVVRDLP